MLGFGVTGQFAIGEVGSFAEIISVDKWFVSLSEPVRFPSRLNAAQQQFAALQDPFPFVSFSWFEPLSEPVRAVPRSPAAMAPFHFWQPAPSPFVATGWFVPLSEPARTRPGLMPGQQQFSAADTTVIPTGRLTPWFVPLSEPARRLSGLDAARQQFLAAPSRLLPNPTITGILNAVESGDLFTGGGREWNRVISGEVGAIEQRFTGAETGVIQTLPSVGASGVIEQVTPPVSGAATPVITKANVSIVIV